MLVKCSVVPFVKSDNFSHLLLLLRSHLVFLHSIVRVLACSAIVQRLAFCRAILYWSC